MAGIFLSYSRADRPLAQVIAESLEAEGFTVWWDKVLRAGQTYDEVTETMLRESSVVVVLWSHTSVKSKWVRAEATLGQRNAVVIPAMIEDAERPIMFELTQSANLVGWQGDRSDGNWRGLVEDIRRVIEPAEAAPPASAAAPAADATIENTFWNSIKDTSDPSELEAYLKRYPQGHFSDLARSRLSGLNAAAQPAAAPAPAAKPVAPPPQPVQAEPVKKGSKAPALLAAVIALGAAGWGAVQLLSPSDGESDAEETVAIAETAVICEICPELVTIPSGTFMIGSPASEPGRVGNEGPQTSISLSGFEMSKTEITGEEWAACVSDGACSAIRSAKDMPASSVSWDDAQAYARWLSSKTGRAYRLPTEAEWEYAARAGTSSAYWWGDSFSAGPVVRGSVAPAGAGQANAFGLVGMLGNVREWVEDCYVNSYMNIPADGRAVQSGNCNLRVVRGGSYKHGASEHRAANRARNAKNTKSPAIGFRVVVSRTADE